VSAGDDDEYTFINNSDWIANGILPDEFTKFNDDKKDKLTTFNALSDWAKWLILSSKLVRTDGDVNQSDEDYRILTGHSLLNTAINRTNTFDKQLISKSLEANFEES